MGLTVLDAGPVIGLLSRSDTHHHSSVQVVSECHGRGDHLLLPASALAEVLVYPSAEAPDDVDTARRLLRRLAVSVVPLD